MQKDLKNMVAVVIIIIVVIAVSGAYSVRTFQISENSAPLVLPTTRCQCSFQVQLDEKGTEPNFLTKSYKMYSCNKSDLFKCRMMCVYQMINKWTHEPHATGTAYSKKSGTKVNIVNEACTQQKQTLINVRMRYELCGKGDKNFMTFKFCCEYSFGHDKEFFQLPSTWNDQPQRPIRRFHRTKRDTKSKSAIPFTATDDMFSVYENRIRTWHYSQNQHCYLE